MQITLKRSGRATGKLLLVGGSAIASLLTSAASAAAERAQARLEYERAPAAMSCPDEPALRRAVAERLGYDPFDDQATSTIVVGIGPLGTGLVADVERKDASGASVGSRSIASNSPSCDALAGAVALAVSIAVDPAFALAAPVGAPAAAPDSDPSNKAAPNKDAPDKAAPDKAAPDKAAPDKAAPDKLGSGGPSRDKGSSASSTAPDTEKGPSEGAPPAALRFAAGAGLLGALGVAPNVGFGLLAHVELRRAFWAVGVEGRVDVPIAAGLPGGGTISTTLLAGRLAPCLHMNILFGCGIVTAGALLGQSDGVPQAARRTTPFVSAGLRMGAELRVLPLLHLRGQVDIEGTITRTTFEIAGEPVWTSPPVNGALSLMALVPFL